MVEIGGLVPFSLSDYPGRVAAVVFTQGCNFSCPYCHNSSLIPRIPGSMAGPQKVMEFLKGRRDRLSGVVISGGEPTIHEGLHLFLSQIRSIGLPIKLDTNGSNPELLSRLLKSGLLDFIAMDIKGPWHKYDLVSGRSGAASRVRQSMAIVAESGIGHLFRTTVVPGLLDDDDLDEISSLIPSGSPHIFQPYRPPGSLAA